MLKRADWRALQSKPTDASEPIQLEFSFPMAPTAHSREGLRRSRQTSSN